MSDFLHKAKIAQFNRGLFLDEHVLRFNVSMEKPMAMDIVKS